MGAITKIGKTTNVLLKPFGIAIVRLNKKPKQCSKSKSELSFGVTHIDFNEAENLRLLREVFPKFKKEYSAFQYYKDEGVDPFYLFNGLYQAGDAEILYCLVRHFSPRRVIEVGCGFSTMVIRKAINNNQMPCTLICIDPSPSVDISKFADELFLNRVEELSEPVFSRLQENDILFIDTCHIVTQRSYIAYLFLDVLPSLRPGVIVHIHDIFLPFDYPTHVEGWNEQYYVQAFLAFNKSYEVFWASSFMWSRYPQDMSEIFPSLKLAGRDNPGSLWIRRVS